MPQNNSTTEQGLPEEKIVQTEEKNKAVRKKEENLTPESKRKARKKKALDRKALRQSLIDINKKIRDIGAEKKALKEEKKQFLREIKIFGIKLKPILKEESLVENKIERIGKRERTASPEKRKHIEKERWEMDEKRRKIEKTKWLLQGNIKKIKEEIKIIDARGLSLIEIKKKLEAEKETISPKKGKKPIQDKIPLENKVFPPITEKKDTKEEIKETANRKEPPAKKEKEIVLLLETSPEKKKEEEIKQVSEKQKQEAEKKKFEEEKKRTEEEKKKREEMSRETEELRKSQEEISIKVVLPPITGQFDINEENRTIGLIPKAGNQAMEPEKKPGFLAKIFRRQPAAETTYLPETFKKSPEKTTEKIQEVRLERKEPEIKREEVVIKERYIPYTPEEPAKQVEFLERLKKREEELIQQHKKELEKQAEEIKMRQKEEMRRQEEKWRAERERIRAEREEAERKQKTKPEKKESEIKSKKEEVIIKEKYIPYIPDDLIKRREMIKELEKEEKELKEPSYEELSEEQKQKRKIELETRRKEIEEEVRKIEQEELRRIETEKIKLEERAKREKEEEEKMEKEKRSGGIIKKQETIIGKIEGLEKEKALSEEEKRVRQQKEKELQPIFELAVKHFKEKDFDKASELLIKIREQALEPEKEPKFLAKITNRLPLYIKAEDYLKKIERKETVKNKKEVRKKSKKKEKEEKKPIPVQKDEWKKQPFSNRFFDFFRRGAMFYHPIIGIDISDHSIEILYLNKQKSILAYGRTTIEEGIVRDGEIINQRDLTQALRLTSQRAGFQPFDPRKGSLLRAIVSLPESKIYIQTFTFDSRANLFARVKEKIENTIPFPIDDLYWSYIDSWDEGSNKVKVLCAAALKDVVNSQIYFLKASGINPIAFDIEAASIGRVLLSGEGSKGGTIILDIGARITSLNIFDKNDFISLSATIHTAGLDFIGKTADYLDVSKEKAETTMGEKGFNKENNPSLPALEKEAERIVAEVKQSINFYQGESGRKIEKIILAGGSSLLPNIDNFFQERFKEIKVEIGNPLNKIKRKGGMREERAILYSNVIGLALRSISKNPVKDGINLLPEEIRSRAK